MHSPPPTKLTLQALDKGDEAGIALVAQRMRRTLVEVEGEVTGTALYTMGWLRERVRWHLDPACCIGQVWLAVAASGEVAGHTLVRVEADADGCRFGLFSTSFVAPAWRRQGVAGQLLLQGEAWMRGQGLGAASTWTSSTNTPLVRLYTRHGYAEAERGANEQTGTVMVRLARRWA
jgi:GNAT superfamily N-acetyltransferase